MLELPENFQFLVLSFYSWEIEDQRELTSSCKLSLSTKTLLFLRNFLNGLEDVSCFSGSTSLGMLFLVFGSVK